MFHDPGDLEEERPPRVGKSEPSADDAERLTREASQKQVVLRNFVRVHLGHIGPRLDAVVCRVDTAALGVDVASPDAPEAKTGGRLVKTPDPAEQVDKGHSAKSKDERAARPGPRPGAKILSETSIMAIDTSDFRNGMAFYLDGDVVQILEFQHVKPGKGGAFVRTRLKRLKNGSVVEKTFRSGEKVDPCYIEKVPYQFLFKQGDEVTLMDLDSYEQIQVPEDSLGPQARFLKEEMEVQAVTADGQILGYEMPNFVELVVTETEPGVKGDTVSGSVTKSATVETGATVQVPFHINEGDTVKIDTRSGDYLERISKK